MASNPTKPSLFVLREGWVIPLLGLALVLIIMNTMMFNLALPSISNSFGITAATASWIVTGYSIVFAISSITYSRLADFLPIRRLVVIGLLSLGLSAVAGLFAQSFLPLLIIRILQASGAGAIPALSLVLISRYIPIERRGRAMAAIMSAASLGLGLGPVTGGLLVEYAGWHSLFVVTAATLALIPAFIALLPREKPTAGTFDTAGAVFLGIGSTGLLLFLTSREWIALAAGIVFLALFAVRIRSARNPFVQPSLLSNRRFLTLSAVGVLVYMCSFVTLFLLPQILVNRFGLSSSMAGLIIFPGSFIAMLASRTIGQVMDRRGNGPFIRWAPLSLLGSAVLFAMLASVSYYWILAIYIGMSLGFTIITSSVSNEMSRIMPPELIGSGMGLFQLLQFFSGAFGVAAAASSMVWQRALPIDIAYSNIYWGLAVIAVIAICCAYLYQRSNAAASPSPQRASV